MAATYYIGPGEDIPQITSADTMRLRVMLYDSTDATKGKTGVGYAAVTATYCKPGETSFTAFPSFGTNNWAEIGNGWYDLIIRGGTSAELALLNATGVILVNLAATGAYTQNVARKIVSADVARQDVWTPTIAGYLDGAISGVAAAAATAVWGATTRTLSAFSFTVAATVAGSVGSVASYGTLVADIATAVWGAGTRTLSAFGFTVAATVAGSVGSVASYGTLAADVATAVWGAGTRTLSAFGFTVALTAGHGLALATDLATLAGKFTGITLLAKWLRALARKDAADSTALAEINASGGTYSELTDSQEAIRDTAPLGTAMRGTDGAELAGAAAAAVGTLHNAPDVSTDIAAIKAVTDGLDALLSTTGIALTAAERTALTAAVWGAATRTLSAFGFSVAVSDKTGFSLTDEEVAAIRAGLSTFDGNLSPVTDELDAIKGEGFSPADSLVAIQAAVSTASGAGAFAVVLVVHDGSGNAVEGLGVVVRNTADDDPGPALGVTDSNGHFAAQLDAGDYHVWLGPNGFYSFANPYAITVTESGTLEPLVCEALALPAATDPALCACYLDVRDVDGGALVGADEGFLAVNDIKVPAWPAGLTTGSAALARSGETYYTDANGRLVVNFMRGSVVTLQIGAGNPHGPLKQATIILTVPDAATCALSSGTAYAPA
jgi:hypothetical protein